MLIPLKQISPNIGILLAGVFNPKLFNDPLASCFFDKSQSFTITRFKF